MLMGSNKGQKEKEKEIQSNLSVCSPIPEFISEILVLPNFMRN